MSTNFPSRFESDEHRTSHLIEIIPGSGLALVPKSKVKETSRTSDIISITGDRRITLTAKPKQDRRPPVETSSHSIISITGDSRIALINNQEAHS